LGMCQRVRWGRVRKDGFSERITNPKIAFRFPGLRRWYADATLRYGHLAPPARRDTVPSRLQADKGRAILEATVVLHGPHGFAM